MQKSGILNCNFKHGGKGTKLYEVWCSMRRRCNSPKDKRYKIYGGKGVFVCKDWEDFKNFKEWSIANGYKEGLTIDRIDNNGPYSPNNCRWTTHKVQNNNQSTTTILRIGDVEKPLHEWSDFVGIKPETLRRRIYAGWSIERALFEKVTFDKHEHKRKGALKGDQHENL